MRIRPATPEDASAFAMTERAAAHRPWSESALRSTLERPTTAAWAALELGVVGHLLTSVVLDEAEVLTLAIQPTHQRRGIAASLMNLAHQAWVDAGVRRAFLDVRRDNMPAIALYERTGWQQAGVRANYYADGTDALQMVREFRC